MTAESKPMDLGGARIQDLQERALAGFHADWFGETEHSAVDSGDVIEGIHRSVAASDKLAAPIVQREKDFRIVAGGIAGRFDQQEAMLRGVLAPVQIVASEDVRVVPAKARGVGRKGVTRGLTGRDGRGALFDGAINFRW